ncbi:hypothetical protein [Saccharolobus islandicus]|uniref:Uncharacterized protein n=1 Tax=Saccharolobus islandicus (strain M.14.25 / Kamchatka \|nr:hypothetical protein [Sulfolobus islandicus]ACP38616.1 hypothetical protein M1425_1872 [Sulfolobus islandicus M.14.25]
MNLLKFDWDRLEEMIEEILNARMRTYAFYEYLIVNEKHILVKIYDEVKGQIIHVFTLKLELRNDKLEVSGVN